nr:glycosyltransferase family 39 protein [Methanosarcina sp. KYL-1]
MVIRRILEEGAPLYPSELNYYWRGVAYHYIVAVFSFIYDMNEFWLRFPSVIFGMGIIFLSFYYGRKVNKFVGLLVLLFLTFSPYNLEYSRFARFYIMNSFLYMLSIYTVYEGFIKNDLKYKIASLVICIIMVHTVQLGSSFIFVLGTYFVYEFFIILRSKEKMPVLRKNAVNFFLLGLTTYFCLSGNLFNKFLSVHYTFAYQLLPTLAPKSYPLIKIPEWSFFEFSAKYYLFPLFAILCIVPALMPIIRSNKEKCSYFEYMSLVFILSVIGFEIANRNVIGPRTYLFLDGLFVILSMSSIYIILRILFKNEVYVKFLSLSIVIILVFSIQPSFYEILTLDYGDDITNDPFRTTNVAAYRADYKTTSKYITEKINNEDILISVMEAPYFYLGRTPNYTLNQNDRWNTYSIFDNGNFIYTDDGSLLINKADDIYEIIESNKDKKVWLLVNGASIHVLYTVHVREDFLQFLEKNMDKVVYESPDGYSKVLLFNAVPGNTTE